MFSNFDDLFHVEGIFIKKIEKTKQFESNHIYQFPCHRYRSIRLHELRTKSLDRLFFRFDQVSTRKKSEPSLQIEITRSIDEGSVLYNNYRLCSESGSNDDNHCHTTEYCHGNQHSF